MKEMLREFRGKRKDNGEYVSKFDNSGWVYGFYYETPEHPGAQFDPPSSERMGIIVDTNSCGYPNVLVDKETVGQFTGLHDKNDKEIYEGDIVKVTDHTIEETFESCGDLFTMLMTRTYEVFWNATKWSIKSLEPMLAVDQLIFDLPTNHVTYEIIGNIHDNPELLEEVR